MTMQASTHIKQMRKASAFEVSDIQADFTLTSNGENWNVWTSPIYGDHVLVTIASKTDGIYDSIGAFMPLDVAKNLRDELDATIRELEGVGE